MQRLYTILGTLILAAIGIFILIVFLGYVLQIPSKRVREAPQSTEPVSIQSEPEIDRALMPVRGRDDAAVTIVGYMDFTCSHCAEMNDRLEALWSGATTMRWVWKDVPKTGDAWSMAAHIAARCAGEQGKFWEYRTFLFGSSDRSDRVLQTSAANLGLNIPTWNACRLRSDHEAYFARVREEVVALNITTTPYLFINTTRVQGLVSSRELQQIVNEAVR